MSNALTKTPRELLTAAMQREDRRLTPLPSLKGALGN